MSLKQIELEQLWRSDDIRDTIKFFGAVRNINEMIMFASSRPIAPMDLTLVNFPKTGSSERNLEVIMVVPTVDASDQLSVHFTKLFFPIPVIFVSSSGEYFNYSRSLNYGIVEALKYSPKRIIISNDDVIPCGPIGELLSLIKKYDDTDVLVPSNIRNRYHGEFVTLLCRNSFFTIVQFLWAFKNLTGIANKIGLAFLLRYLRFSKLIPYVAYDQIRQLALSSGLLKPMPFSFVNFADFGIFRSDILKYNRFDEIFINGGEDYDLTVRLMRSGHSFRKIEFTIRSLEGVTLGKNWNKRFFHDIFNSIYFSLKYAKEFSPR